MKNCFVLFGGIVQCEAANCRMQAKCGVCKTPLLYLDSAVGCGLTSPWRFCVCELELVFSFVHGAFPFQSTHFFVVEA